MSLILTLLAVTATCTPTAAPKPDVETVRAFIAAINARDEVAMGSLVKADATFANAPGEATMKLTDILSMLVASNDHGQIDIVEVSSTAEGVAVRTKTGDREMNSTLKLEGGCIVAMGQQ